MNELCVQIPKKAFNSVYLPSLYADNRYLVFYGGAGSGKSYFIAQRYIVKLLECKTCNLLVVRAYANTNRISTYSLLKQVIGKWNLEKYFKCYDSEPKIRCTLNGNTVIFKGLDDSEKLKSVTFPKGELTDIWAEEASEITSEQDFNQLDVRRLIQSSLGKYSIYAYENKGYCAAISSINDYFEFNMDLMKKEVRDELFNPQRPIYTKVRDDAPSRYGLTSNVKNSIIAQGCVINGEVENCVISKGVYVGEGAKLSNCIVMQDTKIGCNTNLNYVIIDKDVTIKNGRSLMGYDSYPIYIAKKSVV